MKTIHPALEDRWEQYERVIQANHITDGVALTFERQFMGGQLWHQRFSARAKMLEFSLEFERRIEAGGIDSNNGCVLALFSDGSSWHEDELEDFVTFYRTGRHRQDDSLGKMERHAIETNGQQLSRRITALAYFSRPPFEIAPAYSNWSVRAPKEPWR